MDLRKEDAKIIILSGKARSGKDTSMEMLVILRNTRRI